MVWSQTPLPVRRLGPTEKETPVPPEEVTLGTGIDEVKGRAPDGLVEKPVVGLQKEDPTATLVMCC